MPRPPEPAATPEPDGTTQPPGVLWIHEEMSVAGAVRDPKALLDQIMDESVRQSILAPKRDLLLAEMEANRQTLLRGQAAGAASEEGRHPLRRLAPRPSAADQPQNEDRS